MTDTPQTTVFAALMLIATAVHAQPPDPGSDDAKIMQGYEQWVNEQLTPDGLRCCDISDGRPATTRIRNGHWEAYVTKEKWRQWQGEDGWVRIPDNLIVHEPNPTGWSILWIYNNQVRCFRTPTMT